MPTKKQQKKDRKKKRDRRRPAATPSRPSSFRDTLGRVWVIEVTTRTLKRVRDETGVLLTDLVDPERAAEVGLARDPVLLCEVLWSLVSRDADRRGISEEDFWDAISDDAVDKATDALIWGIVAFFPNPRREIMTKVLRAGERAAATAIKIAQQTSEIEIEKSVGILLKIPSDSASKSQPSPESNPGNTTSET